MSPSIDVKYDAIYPRPVSFNMNKQLSRDRNPNDKISVEPDIRVLES